MQYHPVIGVPSETVQHIPGQLSAGWILGHHYLQPLIDLGAVPWIVPLLPSNDQTLQAICSRLDGIYLAGGMDIDPASYGEERHPLCGKTDSARDWTEMQLIRWALRDRKPIFGVCRGIQMINVAAGGTLYQDVPTEVPGAIAHERMPPTDDPGQAIFHTVHVEPGSRLHGILGATETSLNSIHHQAIKDLGTGLRVTARTADGLIEAVEASVGSYVVGVQWHPEELTESMASMRQLYQSFLAAASLAG